MKHYAIFARIGAGVMLMVAWGLTDGPLSGVVLLLALTALSAVRYSFAPLRWLFLPEAAVCAGFAFVWLPALLGLWLPVVSLLEDRWDAMEKELLTKAIEDRGERLKLEALRETSAQEARNAARLAEMAERSRIAQDIHDNVGHEISGASIALQTALKLFEKNDFSRSKDLLAQSAKRLETASERLREAVHNLKPSRIASVGTLRELCDDFEFSEIRFSAAGDLGGVPHWELLAANLREALTNVSRHSDATLVTVDLIGNADSVRLRVADNGHNMLAPKPGLGLSGMRDRIRAAGGVFTINAENGFSVVMVLPKS
jgi:signal transduction histidine kinase